MHWIFDVAAEGGKLLIPKRTKVGAPAVYKVMQSERPEGAWEDVATVVTTEATLVEQPEKIQLEYRVIAVNKSGEGQASNTVMMVL